MRASLVAVLASLLASTVTVARADGVPWVTVQVSPGAVKTNGGMLFDEAKLVRVLHDSTVTALRKQDSITIIASTGESRTQRTFYVDPEVVKLEHTATKLHCTVEMMLTAPPQMNPFSTATGSGTIADATVPGRDAISDCVATVVEELVATQVVPALRKKMKRRRGDD